MAGLLLLKKAYKHTGYKWFLTIGTIYFGWRLPESNR